ncbi:hypothetical protein ARAM_004206 [Aspergillus rambellii]|uniref:Uncharacterized protein n=1 Tax=Aspergillus rambellii TaxID=308745 RepID=A0A0F8V3K6_9EURO|nr:hypothetical protein ARAM_004206 [Aspergillus rambellii]
MNPYLSWAIVLVVAGGLGWYYNDTNAKGKTPVKPLAEKTESAPSAKKQKRKVKKSPEPSPAPAPSSEKPTFEFKAPEVDTQDEEIDRKEMAKRFAAVKNGTSSQFADGESKSQKKKKKTTKAAAVPPQPEASNNERSASRVSTRTSSTTGADADDDLSPAGSPQVNPTVSSTGYVSDMLEAPAPGASVLRVTGSMDSDSQKKKAKNQSFKPVETKKQRQQRLKNEARKQQVQEAEEQRRKLLEKQLHTARESERREAAKSTPAPQTNAWQVQETPQAVNGTPEASQSTRAPQTAKVELLDTFEPGLPSEEEQMRILGATDDAWTTVSSKKTKKKGGKDESEVSASESQPAPIPAPISTSAPAPVEPKVKVTPTYLPDILQSKEKGHPLDSDWAA